MDIAVQLEKIKIGENKFIFKTAGLITGYYDEINGSFLDEYNEIYDEVKEDSFNCERFFCYPVTLNKLREIYTNKLDDKEILDAYLETFINVCYLGCLVKGKMQLIEINFDEIEESISNSINNQKEDNKEDDRFIFDLEMLKELKEYKSLDDIKKYLDTLIKTKDYLKDTFDQQNVSEALVSKQKTEPSNKIVLDKNQSNKFSLNEMRDFVLSEIIAQDEAVKRITTCIMSNIDSSDYRRKKHLLLTGPTGTGKSKTIQLICEYLDIPYTKVDSTDYTQAGFVGRSVDEMIERLIYAANGDIKKAEKGIIVVDEIDKKTSKGEGGEGVATKAVMDSLLKITGRGIVQVDIVKDKTKQTIDFDTANITVIFTGAFEGIEEINNNKSIGFVNETVKKDNNNLHKALIKYGMTPELIGRIKCIVPLKGFDEEDYVQILKYSKSSPLIVEKYYYEHDKNIKFMYTSSCIKELAKRAKELGVGARGLETVVSEMLEDVQERVLNNEKIKELKVTKRTVLNNKEYYVGY